MRSARADGSPALHLSRFRRIDAAQGWESIIAYAINEVGQIVGWGVRDR
jgi:hypothetical protein